MPKSFMPDLFEFSMLDLLDFNEISLIWEEDALIFYRGDKEKAYTPSREKWGNFWLKLNELNIWNWENEYVDKNILDGETWSLTIIYQENELNSTGTNAYPAGFKDFKHNVKLLLS